MPEFIRVISQEDCRVRNLADFITGQPSGNRPRSALKLFMASEEDLIRACDIFNGLAHYDASNRTLVFAVEEKNDHIIDFTSHEIRNADMHISAGLIARARQQSSSYTPAREIVEMGDIVSSQVNIDFVTGDRLSGLVPSICMTISDSAIPNIERLFEDRFCGDNFIFRIATAPQNAAALVRLKGLLKQKGNLLTYEMIAQARGAISKPSFTV